MIGTPFNSRPYKSSVTGIVSSFASVFVSALVSVLSVAVLSAIWVSLSLVVI